MGAGGAQPKGCSWGWGQCKFGASSCGRPWLKSGSWQELEAMGDLGKGVELGLGGGWEA